MLWMVRTSLPFTLTATIVAAWIGGDAIFCTVKLLRKWLTSSTVPLGVIFRYSVFLLPPCWES